MQASKLRGTVRAIAFLSFTFGLLPFYLVASLMGPGACHAIRRFWSRGVSMILGIRVRRTGTTFRACPTLYVSNHVSYLDIVCIGLFTDATFIAKAEVAGWPLFGFIAKLTGTMFVRRYWRAALIQRNALASRMRAGEHFILFGEGTSSDGMDVRPFKTSLLSVAEPWVLDRPVAVQPIAIVYVRLRDGTLVDATNTNLYAWWGSAKMLPHLWRMVQLAGAEVEVHFGTPVLSWAITSRKVLGRELRAEVLHTLGMTRGHLRPSAQEPENAAPALT